MPASKGLRQAYEVQDACHAAIMSMREDNSKGGKLVLSEKQAGALKGLVQAWEAAQRRISFHRRVPDPGVLRPSELPRRRRRKELALMDMPTSGGCVAQGVN